MTTATKTAPKTQAEPAPAEEQKKPETAVATRAPASAPVAMGTNGAMIQSIESLYRFAQMVERSGFAPKNLERVDAIAAAIQMGMELGLTPMAALQNIAIINGRPSVYGDAQLGIVRATGQLEEFDEWFEHGGKRLQRNPTSFDESTTAVCHAKRRDYEPIVSAFSVADAKRAGLWGKQGPWSQYPARMLRFRARSFGLRDTFGDALKGLRSAEEVVDIEGETVKEPRRLSQPKGDLPAPADPTTDNGTAAEAAAAQPTNEEPTPAGEVQKPTDDLDELIARNYEMATEAERAIVLGEVTLEETKEFSDDDKQAVIDGFIVKRHKRESDKAKPANGKKATAGRLQLE